jgi:hypothetical protein
MEFVKSYFNAEKSAGVLFIVVGVSFLLISLYSWLTIKKPFYTGMAYPFLLIGLIEITVGVTIYLKSPADNDRVENYLTLEPERILNEEIPRMETVMKSFVYYRYVEFAFIFTGVMLMFYIGKSELVKGIGFGLFIQGTVMLGADYIAERRGHLYLERLRQEVSGLNKQS